MSDRFSIGEIARLLGITTRTIRHYEALGLAPRPTRMSNGYRSYSVDDLNRLTFICRAKGLGLTLAEIAELVVVAEEGRCRLTQTELSQLLVRKISECTRRIDALTTFRATLQALSEQVAPPSDSHSADSCTGCSAFSPSCSCFPLVEDKSLDLDAYGKV